MEISLHLPHITTKVINVIVLLRVTDDYLKALSKSLMSLTYNFQVKLLKFGVFVITELHRINAVAPNIVAYFL